MEHKARGSLHAPAFARDAEVPGGWTITDTLTGLVVRLRERVRWVLEPKPVLMVYNPNSVRDDPRCKRALMVYLPQAFLFNENGPEFFAHQSFRQCKQIAALLADFGYIVDVAHKSNWRRVKHRDYDLIIADRADYQGLDSFSKSAAPKIFLATSMDYGLHNTNLRRRHERLVQRRNLGVEIRRHYPEAMPYLARADAVAGFGNGFIMSSWTGRFSGPLYPFNNYGFANTADTAERKNYREARRHFLFFASRSQVQKGLDLLLEIFPKHPDLHLYICSDFEKERDFCAAYRKELYETRNIHPIGWLTVNSALYNEVVQKCAYVIHPTCSEGQPGSVVQCMHSGLIPLVTKWAGIDTKDFGVTFDEDSLEAIERTVVAVSQLPEEWHRQRSIRTRQVAEAQYSEHAFVNRWRQILAEILKEPEAMKDRGVL